MLRMEPPWATFKHSRSVVWWHGEYLPFRPITVYRHFPRGWAAAMSDDKDLCFDIDALFDHLVNNLDHDLAEEQDWHFTIRSNELEPLESLAEELEEEFFVHVQENVEEHDVDGGVSVGPPMMTVICRGAFSVEEVKELAERMQSIADNRGLTYEGVNCYDPIDEQELLGWLAPEDAGWRLRHMTDLGMEVDAELPWAFLVMAPSVESTEQIAAELAAEGFGDRDDFDEPDDEGNFGMCVFVEGRNNAAALQDTATQISNVASRHGGELYGIQFYTREDVIEIFGDEDTTEED